jgi:hypothetical protein
MTRVYILLGHLLWYVVVILLALSIGACTLDPVNHTPEDALDEPPGKVQPQYKDSLHVLARQPIGEGISLLYRWEMEKSASTGTFCIAATFVSFEGAGQGWKAQSTGYLVGDRVSQPACDLGAPIGLRTSFFQGGKQSTITTVYGLTDLGDKIRISWSDGKIDTQEVQAEAFLLSRQGAVAVRHVEVIDITGAIRAREVWR